MGRGAPMKEFHRSLWALAAIPAAALVVLASAAPGCGSSSNPVKNRPDGGPLCSNGSGNCPSGTQCNNGTCVTSCDPSGACPSGTFCEGNDPSRNVCAPTAYANCTIDQDCPLPQFCLSNLCVSRELRADGGFQGCILTGNDGCANDAVCYQAQSASGAVSNTCIGLPACGQDGTCPVGTAGSACNDLPDGGRLFPAKQRVCLYSFCAEAANCPAAAFCFRSSNTSPLGGCSFGTAGSGCFTNADCLAARACVGADGGFDAGGSPGICQQ